MFRILIAGVTLLVSLSSACAQSDRADIEAVVKNYLATHPEDVERIVRNYLINDPDVLKDALAELIKRRSARTSSDKSAAIKSNFEQLFNSPRQVTLGYPSGDVTLVEFFDYNCGFCKRALADMMTLLRDNPNLRVVLKELPILGPGSVEAAKVAIAVRMQDPTGGKYLAFHRKLLGERGHASMSVAKAAARDSGIDMARLERDLLSDEVSKTLDESSSLARALGITGTPAYVVGDTVIPGAVGSARLQEQIRNARK